MIAIANRFHGHNSLRSVYQKGRSVYGDHCKLLWQPAQKQNYRVAVVVSKKIHKSAVARNRVRRRIYEVVRTYAKDNSLRSDIVIIVQKDSLIMSTHQELQAEISKLLKKTTSVL